MTATPDKNSQFEEQAIPLIPKLLQAALKETGNNRVESDDLVQDTLAKAYRYWDTFEQGTNLLGWLKTILHNTYINRAKKEARHKAVGTLSDLEDFQIGADAKSLTATTARSAEAEALARLASNEVENALENLKPEYRAVVKLAILEGYSYQEIADILNIKLGTVMSRLHRGKKSLRETLYEYAEQEGYKVEK